MEERVSHNATASITHIKGLIADYDELKEKYTKLKEKYDSKIEAHKRKKAAAATAAGTEKPGKKAKGGDEESLSDTPASTQSVKKERAPPKCSICKKPKKEGDHSKCATELAKKREAKKAKASESKDDVSGDGDSSPSD